MLPICFVPRRPEGLHGALPPFPIKRYTIWTNKWGKSAISLIFCCLLVCKDLFFLVH